MTKAERRSMIRAQNAGKKVETLNNLYGRVEVGGTRNSTFKKVLENQRRLEKAREKFEEVCTQVDSC